MNGSHNETKRLFSEKSEDKGGIPLILAPMAGITDHAFRVICHRFGASFSFTEMISAKAIHYGDRKTASLALLGGEGRVGIQIFGSDPEIMAEAAARLASGDYVGADTSAKCAPDMIDINMGCPVKKIAGSGDGSALMKNPDRIYEIVSAVKKSCPLPIGVKMRTGWDSGHINALECAAAAAEGGVSVITVHGRTREQFYSPPIDYETIAAVKGAVEKTGKSIFVIGNGGISDAESAKKMIDTGVDGLMIGQGAIGRPWIFDELAAALAGERYTLPDVGERISIAAEHIRLLAAEKGEYTAVHEGRKHLMWYVRGMRGAAEFRDRVCRIESLPALEDALSELETENRGTVLK